MSGGGSGSADRSIQLQQEEEARKAQLRKRISYLFGEGPETERYQVNPGVPATTPRNRGASSGPNPAAIFSTRRTPVAAARKQFETEETDLSGALRGQYEDDLKKQFGRAERATRFGAANTGNVGGSVYSDALSELEEQNALGGTRIEQSVRRAVNNLRSSREDSKLRALNLVNAGTGEEAVQSARSGIGSALDNARAASREDLFTDLFSDISLAKQGSDSRDRNAALAAYFSGLRNRGLSAPSSTGAGPRIISTG